MTLKVQDLILPYILIFIPLPVGLLRAAELTKSQLTMWKKR